MNGERDCPSREMLAAFLLGKLPPEREEALNLHLETCVACEEQAQQIEQESDVLIDALRQPETGSSAWRMVEGGGEIPGQQHPQQLSVTMVTPRVAGIPLPAGEPLQVEGYRILGEVGRGGMGIVYRAFQQRLNRMVAIKMILAGSLAGTEERVRFLMEGELLARLNHPNFVQVHEVGTVELSPGTVQPYLVLEYVQGGSLKVRMAGQPLPVPEAARLVLILARAMENAHSQGIIHRDLKPANVLIACDGTLKISDFGLAKELGTNASLTPTGLAVGTPCYMAPEQARGDATIGPATDVYALGAILYEMLTGRPPFRGETPMEILLQVLNHTPVPTTRLSAGIPRDLETICLKCLEKEPRARYVQAADLADDLERWLEHRPIRARPAGRIEYAYKWARRHPLPATLLLVLMLSLLAGSTVSTYFGVSAVNRADEAQIALGKEQDARQLAEEAIEAERWERYLSDISAASNALQLHNISPARWHLEAAPAKYRNWEWRHFDSQLEGSSAVLRGDPGVVGNVDFRRDGKWLASGSADRTIRIWDTTTGQQVMVLRAPDGRLRDGRFSPDGSRLVTGGDRLRLWDPATGKLCWAAEPSPPSGDASWPFWSNDGRLVVGTEGDVQMHVRDAATGKKVFSRARYEFRPVVALSPDGRHVAANQEDKTVLVWEMATGKEVKLSGHKRPVTALAYSPDGRRIATGSLFSENEIRIWDAATGELLGQGRGHINEVNFLAFSPDGQRLASCSLDQTVRLWDVPTGQLLATLRGHNNYVVDLAFSPDGTQLLSASADQTLRLWDVSVGLPASDLGQLITVLRGHTGAVTSVRFNRAGTLIASSSTADRTIRLWDAELVARNGVLRGHTEFIYDVAFRPDGAEVASGDWDGKVRLWDPTTGRQTAMSPLQHDTKVVGSLAYSPNGKRLAVVLRQKGVCLWDLSGPRPPVAPTFLWEEVAGDWKAETRVAFHPEGTLLAWGSYLGPIRLWDLVVGKEVGVLKGHECCRDVAFRPDGKELASVGKDGSVRLWDLATRRQTAVFAGSRDTYRLVYSADGRWLAAGADDKTVRLWNVQTRKQVEQLRMGSTVYGVAFSPDGTRLACACADNTIRLLDPVRLREVGELRGHTAYVHTVEFSRDGTRLVSASGDHTVRIWDTLSAQQRAKFGAR